MYKRQPDYSRIINEGAFQRIKQMVDNTKGKILLGGSMDEKEKFIEPTVVLVDSTEDSLITEESFGPIITLLPVSNLDEAIRIANDVDGTPLALYPFGSKEETAKGIIFASLHYDVLLCTCLHLYSPLFSSFRRCFCERLIHACFCCKPPVWRCWREWNRLLPWP